MADIQEQFEALAAEASYHQHYAREIENQMRAIAQVESEMDRTLQALKNIKNDNISLFNLGSGIFLKGQIKDSNKLLLNVGANIFIESTVEDSISFLTEKKKELDEAKNDLIRSMETITERLKQIDVEARRLMTEQAKQQ